MYEAEDGPILSVPAPSGRLMPVAVPVLDAVSLTRAVKPSVRSTELPDASFFMVCPSVSICVPSNPKAFFWVTY